MLRNSKNYFFLSKNKYHTGFPREWKIFLELKKTILFESRLKELEYDLSLDFPMILHAQRSVIVRCNFFEGKSQIKVPVLMALLSAKVLLGSILKGSIGSIIPFALTFG